MTGWRCSGDGRTSGSWRPTPARRLGLPFWQYTLTATDANRHAIRYARMVTGRRKIVVHNFCYHASMDGAFGTLESGVTVSRRSSVGPPCGTFGFTAELADRIERAAADDFD